LQVPTGKRAWERAKESKSKSESESERECAGALCNLEAREAAADLNDDEQSQAVDTHAARDRTVPLLVV
jgi:hypothetical protein